MATTKKTAKKTTTKPKAATTRPTTAKKSTSTALKDTATTTKTDQGLHLSVNPTALRTVMADSAYATLGAGDYAVEVARDLPQRLDAARKQRGEQVIELVKDAPNMVREVPSKLQAEVNDSLETVRKELDTYATRGRKVVQSINNAKATKQAKAQTENARTAVKGAVTSIRRAAKQNTEAVEGAVDKLGKRR